VGGVRGVQLRGLSVREAPDQYDRQNERDFRQQVGEIKVQVDEALERLRGDMTISELSDVVITSVATGEVLKFDGSDWINQTLVEANIAALDAANVFTGGSITISESGTPRLDFVEDDVGTDIWRIALSAGSMRFQSVDVDTGAFEWRRSGGTQLMTLDVPDPAADETSLILRNSGGFDRVSLGSSGSGGTGFKLLRVPN